MKKMSKEEIKEHRKALEKFDKKLEKSQAQYIDGEIGSNKLNRLKRDIKESREFFIRDSGVIFYYGTYFRKSA